jgi:hypothetical protein
LTNLWTPPFAWDVTKALTVARLNALIGNDGVNPGNLNVLFEQTWLGVATGASLTTTSTAYADVGGLTITHPNVQSGNVIVIAQINGSADATTILKIGICLDGAAAVDLLNIQPDDYAGTYTVLRAYSGLSVGSHTWKIQGRTTTAGITARVEPASPSAIWVWGY